MNFNLTLIGQMISFVVFVWFTMTYVWTPIVKALEDRKAKIAEGLAAAERGHQEKELGEQARRRDHARRQGPGRRIIGQAQKRATEIIEEAKVDARAEGSACWSPPRPRSSRRPTAPARTCAARSATLAVAAAEKILQKEIDAARPPGDRRLLRQADLRG